MTRWCSSCEVSADGEDTCWCCGARYDTASEPVVTLHAPPVARERPLNTPTVPWWQRLVGAGGV